jgi:hypothetical protein
VVRASFIAHLSNIRFRSMMAKFALSRGITVLGGSKQVLFRYAPPTLSFAPCIGENWRRGGFLRLTIGGLLGQPKRAETHCV